MLKVLVSLALCAFVSSSVMAELSPEEAQAKLAAKEQQRQAERKQIVQMSAGELADMQAKIRQLEAEVAGLRAQLNQKEAAKKSPVRSMIEIGMTKDEVLAFINRDKTLHITAMAANAGVNRSSSQVIVKGNSSLDKNVTVTRNDDDPTRTRTQSGIARDSSVEVETVQRRGLSETIEIEKTHASRQIIGYGPARGLGAPPDDIYGEVVKVTGHITVDLVDGVVTAVVAH